MVWSLDLDDFTGKFCNNGKYPLLNVINEHFQSFEKGTPTGQFITRTGAEQHAGMSVNKIVTVTDVKSGTDMGSKQMAGMKLGAIDAQQSFSTGSQQIHGKTVGVFGTQGSVQLDGSGLPIQVIDGGRQYLGGGIRSIDVNSQDSQVAGGVGRTIGRQTGVDVGSQLNDAQGFGSIGRTGIQTVQDGLAMTSFQSGGQQSGQGFSSNSFKPMDSIAKSGIDSTQYIDQGVQSSIQPMHGETSISMGSTKAGTLKLVGQGDTVGSMKGVGMDGIDVVGKGFRAAGTQTHTANVRIDSAQVAGKGVQIESTQPIGESFIPIGSERGNEIYDAQKAQSSALKSGPQVAEGRSVSSKTGFIVGGVKRGSQSFKMGDTRTGFKTNDQTFNEQPMSLMHSKTGIITNTAQMVNKDSTSPGQQAVADDYAFITSKHANRMQVGLTVDQGVPKGPMARVDLEGKQFFGDSARPLVGVVQKDIPADGKSFKTIDSIPGTKKYDPYMATGGFQTEGQHIVGSGVSGSMTVGKKGIQSGDMGIAGESFKSMPTRVSISKDQTQMVGMGTTQLEAKTDGQHVDKGTFRATDSKFTKFSLVKDSMKSSQGGTFDGQQIDGTLLSEVGSIDSPHIPAKETVKFSSPRMEGETFKTVVAKTGVRLDRPWVVSEAIAIDAKSKDRQVQANAFKVVGTPSNQGMDSFQEDGNVLRMAGITNRVGMADEKYTSGQTITGQATGGVVASKYQMAGTESGVGIDRRQKIIESFEKPSVIGSVSQKMTDNTHGPEIIMGADIQWNAQPDLRMESKQIGLTEFKPINPQTDSSPGDKQIYDKVSKVASNQANIRIDSPQMTGVISKSFENMNIVKDAPREGGQMFKTIDGDPNVGMSSQAMGDNAFGIITSPSQESLGTQKSARIDTQTYKGPDGLQVTNRDVGYKQTDGGFDRYQKSETKIPKSMTKTDGSSENKQVGSKMFGSSQTDVKIANQNLMQGLTMTTGDGSLRSDTNTKGHVSFKQIPVEGFQPADSKDRTRINNQQTDSRFFGYTDTQLGSVPNEQPYDESKMQTSGASTRNRVGKEQSIGSVSGMVDYAAGDPQMGVNLVDITHRKTDRYAEPQNIMNDAIRTAHFMGIGKFETSVESKIKGQQYVKQSIGTHEISTGVRRLGANVDPKALGTFKVLTGQGKDGQWKDGKLFDMRTDKQKSDYSQTMPHDTPLAGMPAASSEDKIFGISDTFKQVGKATSVDKSRGVMMGNKKISDTYQPGQRPQKGDTQFITFSQAKSTEIDHVAGRPIESKDKVSHSLFSWSGKADMDVVQQPNEGKFLFQEFPAAKRGFGASVSGSFKDIPVLPKIKQGIYVQKDKNTIISGHTTPIVSDRIMTKQDKELKIYSDFSDVSFRRGEKLTQNVPKTDYSAKKDLRDIPFKNAGLTGPQQEYTAGDQGLEGSMNDKTASSAKTFSGANISKVGKMHQAIDQDTAYTGNLGRNIYKESISGAPGYGIDIHADRERGASGLSITKTEITGSQGEGILDLTSRQSFKKIGGVSSNVKFEGKDKALKMQGNDGAVMFSHQQFKSIGDAASSKMQTQPVKIADKPGNELYQGQFISNTNYENIPKVQNENIKSSITKDKASGHASKLFLPSGQTGDQMDGKQSFYSGIYTGGRVSSSPGVDASTNTDGLGSVSSIRLAKVDMKETQEKDRTPLPFKTVVDHSASITINQQGIGTSDSETEPHITKRQGKIMPDHVYKEGIVQTGDKPDRNSRMWDSVYKDVRTSDVPSYDSGFPVDGGGSVSDVQRTKVERKTMQDASSANMPSSQPFKKVSGASSASGILLKQKYQDTKVRIGPEPYTTMNQGISHSVAKVASKKIISEKASTNLQTGKFKMYPRGEDQHIPFKKIKEVAGLSAESVLPATSIIGVTRVGWQSKNLKINSGQPIQVHTNKAIEGMHSELNSNLKPQHRTVESAKHRKTAKMDMPSDPISWILQQSRYASPIFSWSGTAPAVNVASEGNVLSTDLSSEHSNKQNRWHEKDFKIVHQSGQIDQPIVSGSDKSIQREEAMFNLGRSSRGFTEMDSGKKHSGSQTDSTFIKSGRFHQGEEEKKQYQTSKVITPRKGSGASSSEVQRDIVGFRKLQINKNTDRGSGAAILPGRKQSEDRREERRGRVATTGNKQFMQISSDSLAEVGNARRGTISRQGIVNDSAAGEASFKTISQQVGNMQTGAGIAGMSRTGPRDGGNVVESHVANSGSERQDDGRTFITDQRNFAANERAHATLPTGASGQHTRIVKTSFSAGIPSTQQRFNIGTASVPSDGNQELASHLQPSGSNSLNAGTKHQYQVETFKVVGTQPLAAYMESLSGDGQDGGLKRLSSSGQSQMQNAGSLNLKSKSGQQWGSQSSNLQRRQMDTDGDSAGRKTSRQSTITWGSPYLDPIVLMRPSQSDDTSSQISNVPTGGRMTDESGSQGIHIVRNTAGNNNFLDGTGPPNDRSILASRNQERQAGTGQTQFISSKSVPKSVQCQPGSVLCLSHIKQVVVRDESGKNELGVWKRPS